jgi:hypothetical protein
VIIVVIYEELRNIQIKPKREGLSGYVGYAKEISIDKNFSEIFWRGNSLLAEVPRYPRYPGTATLICGR